MRYHATNRATVSIETREHVKRLEQLNRTGRACSMGPQQPVQMNGFVRCARAGGYASISRNTRKIAGVGAAD